MTSKFIIICPQHDVMLGEKVSLVGLVDGAEPHSTVSIDISTEGHHWPATLHVNAVGSGSCVSTDVILPGATGTITAVHLAGTARSNANDSFESIIVTVRVHG
jgi:hypothetical protein